VEERWLGLEKRQYFRVEDICPLLVRKVPRDSRPGKSRIVAMIEGCRFEDDAVDETVNPRLWRLLLAMNSKLGLILEKLYIESEGLTEEKKQKISLSETGIGFTIPDRFEIGDLIQVKMLLPIIPFTGIVLYGEVIRVKEHESNEYETALQFLDMDDDVRSVIRKHIFRRQREVMVQEMGYND